MAEVESFCGMYFIKGGYTVTIRSMIGVFTGLGDTLVEAEEDAMRKYECALRARIQAQCGEQIQEQCDL